MPELPEVEHTRRMLEAWALLARITTVTVSDPRIVRPTSPRTFAAKLTGQTLRALTRRGKWLRASLDDFNLFIHLGMTGWFTQPGCPSTKEKKPSKTQRGRFSRTQERGVAGAERFERVRFELRQRPAIVYVDPRRWGRLIVAEGEIDAWTKLGPDPLVDGIDPEALHAKLQRRKARSIKEVLLDQTVLAGVGNIQSIEALWRARIDPRSAAHRLTLAQVSAIAAGLRWSIKRTLVDLEKGNGLASEGGDNNFRVYGRKGEPCPRCARALDRIELGGRTTTLCQGCQAFVD